MFKITRKVFVPCSWPTTFDPVCVTEWPRLNVAECGSLEETVTRGLPLPWPWTSYRPNCASADYNPGSTGFSVIQFRIHFILPRWLTRIRDRISLSLVSNEINFLFRDLSTMKRKIPFNHHRLGIEVGIVRKKQKNIFWIFQSFEKFN